MLAAWEYDLRIRPVLSWGQTAGQWQTEDGRFLIVRLSDPDTGKLSHSWSLASGYEAEADWLASLGLDKATFRTQREALTRLAECLGAPLPDS